MINIKVETMKKAAQQCWAYGRTSCQCYSNHLLLGAHMFYPYL